MSSNEIATLPAQLTQVSANVLTADQVELIKRTYCKGASDDELALFLNVAKRTGLDPFSRQIYAVFRKDKQTGKDVMTIQTGIDGYRQIADRQGNYAGSDDPTFNEGLSEFAMRKSGESILTATVTVWKIVAGVRCPFTATAGWDSYCPAYESLQRMWKQFPYLMLAKCAEGLALRKGWAAQMSGVYTDAEMQQAEPPSEPIGYADSPMKITQGSTKPPHTPFTAKQQAQIDADKVELDRRSLNPTYMAEVTIESVTGYPVPPVVNAGILDLPAGTQHISAVLAALPDGIESAQVVGGNEFALGKPGGPQGVKFVAETTQGRQELFYFNLANAVQRSGMDKPWEHRGEITFRRTKEKSAGKWDIDNLHFPELEVQS